MTPNFILLPVESDLIHKPTLKLQLTLPNSTNRKNAMFHKTQAGVDITDVILAMIATAAEASVNVLDYFNTVQRKPTEVKANPERFLPWNDQSNI